MSNTTTFLDLLTQYRIEIPIIQRDYAQGRSNPASKEIRTNFIQQIKESLDNKEGRLHLNFVYGKVHGKSNAIKIEENKEAINGMLTAVQSYSKNLDLGIKWDFIEGYKSADINNQTSFSPLDGQQRLTTLFLLHWYLMPDCEECKKILKRFNYKIRPSSKDFCEALVENKPNLNDVGEESISKYIRNAAWFFTYWRNDPTVRGMLRMLDQIQSVFGVDNLDEYWQTLTVENKVCFEFLDLDEFKLTDELYIKMNSRGVALTPFENFKAWLIEHIQTNKFKIKNEMLTWSKDKTWVDLLDTTWTDLFWANKDADNMLIDEELMRYFRNMAQIFLMFDDQFTPEYNGDVLVWKKFAEKCRRKASLLATEKGNNGEYKYIPNSFFVENKLFTENNLNLLFKSIYFLSSPNYNLKSIIEILSGENDEEQIKLFGRSNCIFRRFIDKETTYADKILFYALFLYIELEATKGVWIRERSFRNWMRIIRNLVNNTAIGLVEFKKIINSLDKLQCYAYSLQSHLAKNEIHIEGFDRVQMKEEIRKAKLTCKNGAWEKVFLKYENHNYFRGQIDFLLTIADCEKNDDIELFESYAEKLSNIFSHKLENRDSVLFERALLTESSEDLHDYLVRVHSNDSFVSLFSNDKYSTNWKVSVFRDKKRLVLVRQLLDRIEENKEIKGLNHIRKNHTRTGWRKQIIASPAAINFCKKKLIRYVNETNIKLLGQFATNHNHAELFSFCLDKRIKKDLDTNLLRLDSFKRKIYKPVTRASDHSHAALVGEGLLKDFEIHLHFDDVNKEFLKLPYEIKFFTTIKENNSKDSYDEKVIDVLRKYDFEWKEDEYCEGFWKDVNTDDEVIELLKNMCAELNEIQFVSPKLVEHVSN